MDILNPRNDLLKELASFLFLQPGISHDIVKQFAPTSVLHDQVKLLWRLYYLVQLNDIGVPDKFKDVDFPGHSLDISHISDPFLL